MTGAGVTALATMGKRQWQNCTYEVLGPFSLIPVSVLETLFGDVFIKASLSLISCVVRLLMLMFVLFIFLYIAFSPTTFPYLFNVGQIGQQQGCINHSIIHSLTYFSLMTFTNPTRSLLPLRLTHYKCIILNNTPLLLHPWPPLALPPNHPTTQPTSSALKRNCHTASQAVPNPSKPNRPSPLCRLHIPCRYVCTVMFGGCLRWRVAGSRGGGGGARCKVQGAKCKVQNARCRQGSGLQ